MPMYYISFATAAAFLGATVVRADDAKSAIKEATLRGLNPGGEAMVVEVPPDVESAPDIAPLLNRLSEEDEILGRGGKRVALRSKCGFPDLGVDTASLLTYIKTGN